LKKKISDKDKKDWASFLDSKEKIENKDLELEDKSIINKTVKIIDLHGFSLENANKTIKKFINKCFQNNVNKITVITGKGLRSTSKNNPYVSKNLSILRHSVPEYIRSNNDLMKFINKITEADNQEGGSGAFNIYLKKFKE
jgi:DNA-nicking Smr family endonuclease